MSDTFTIETQIEMNDGIIEDAKHDLKSARSPKRRRNIQHSLDFFSAIRESLEVVSSTVNGFA